MVRFGALKCLPGKKGLVRRAKWCIYEGIIVPRVVYEAKTRAIRLAEKRRVNMQEMMCWVL